MGFDVLKYQRRPLEGALFSLSSYRLPELRLALCWGKRVQRRRGLRQTTRRLYHARKDHTRLLRMQAEKLQYVQKQEERS